MPPPPQLAEWSTDLRVAVGFLTRVPVGEIGPVGGVGSLSRATRVYPVVGLGIGLAGGAAYWLAAALGLPPLIAGLIAVAATMGLTGALHEDGLADTADGFGGGADPERKLEIMRDSRTGAYGAAVLVLSIAIRGTALAALAAPAAVVLALAAAHAVSRACLPAAMATMPLARSSGLAVATGRPEPRDAGIALSLAAAVAVLAQGFGAGLAALLAGVLGAALVAWLARAQIGGYTGDVLGALQQAAEIAVLLTAVALA
ncbi:MAG: adenosylcobinamide-GDP ribazoletransferase [Rhodospirillales bacterium]|nr:adenosylcobinamide-GDP ribazoletransferase [Rhodospirillales bacterium]